MREIEAEFDGIKNESRKPESTGLKNARNECPVNVNLEAASVIREAAPKYGEIQKPSGNSPAQWDRQGEYTLEDYYALLDAQRVELIDGVFYDLASPTTVHQDLAGQIYVAFCDYIKKKKGACRPYIAPVDVQLGRDSRTILQPDVLIVCDREKLKNGIVCGAPDLVVEVLSPSTKDRDQLIKLNKYYNAGVREYWIVNPETRQVLVYNFTDGLNCRAYGEELSVPVGIFHGDCRVDFKEIFEYANVLGD